MKALTVLKLLDYYCQKRFGCEYSCVRLLVRVPPLDEMVINILESAYKYLFTKKESFQVSEAKIHCLIHAFANEINDRLEYWDRPDVVAPIVQNEDLPIELRAITNVNERWGWVLYELRYTVECIGFREEPMIEAKEHARLERGIKLLFKYIEVL